VIVEDNDQFKCTVQINDKGLKYRIALCYIPTSSEFDSQLQSIFQWANPIQERCFVIGDLNARVGTFFTDHQQTGAFERRSKDEILNQRGKKLIDILRTSNYHVLNGMTKSDSCGEYTFCNRNGSSVIDLCIVSNHLKDETDLKVLKGRIIPFSHHIITQPTGKHQKQTIDNQNNLEPNEV
jgi:hypothetical protein